MDVFTCVERDEIDEAMLCSRREGSLKLFSKAHLLALSPG
jgi:hypothetical protein